jgi:NDP-sugar pyrophosphorylase family protein
MTGLLSSAGKLQRSGCPSADARRIGGCVGVILAGGLGTRLRPVLGDLPKALAPVGGQPFLAYQLHWLKRQGVTRVVLCTGYGHDLIQAYCGDGAALGMQILYSAEDKPLGTAGALQQARRYLNEAFLAMNGDTYFAADLGALLANHRRGGAPATLALVEVPQAARFGAVTLDARGYVVRFTEKRRRRAGLINAGIYVFEPEIWAHFPARVPLSLEDDVFPSLAAQRLLRGSILEGYHIDIGTPDSYAQFQKDVAAAASHDLWGEAATASRDLWREVESHLAEEQ